MSRPSVPLLESLSPRERTTLLQRAIRTSVGPGHYLLFAGDQPKRVYVVESGLVKLVGRNAEGQESIAHLALPGELVGEGAALDHLPQPLDAIAVVRSAVLSLDAAVVVALAGRNAAVGLALARGLAGRTRWMSEATIERSTSQVAARLAGRLLDLADLVGRRRGDAVEVALPLPQSDLGRLAGTTRESTCKALGRLRARGVVDYERDRICILRPEILRAIRCAGRASAPSRSTGAAARRRIRSTPAA